MGSHAAKQIPQAGPQPISNLLDVYQGQVPHAPLNATVIGAVQVASLRSFFLADALFFAQTTNGATKADADVRRHCLQLSWLTSDPYTADESHIELHCSDFVTQTELSRSLLKKCQTATSVHARQCNWLRAQQLACLGRERGRPLCSDYLTRIRSKSKS